MEELKSYGVVSKDVYDNQFSFFHVTGAGPVEDLIINHFLEQGLYHAVDDAKGILHVFEIPHSCIAFDLEKIKKNLIDMKAKWDAGQEDRNRESDRTQFNYLAKKLGLDVKA